VSRVGVVVPVYNVAAYLEPCLASIAAQTHEDLDVLVVDDGSTDDSAAIAARFCDGDPRFRLVQQPNGGLGNARNNGMARVTGDFLAFVDSDDLLPRRAYELLVGALDDSPSDFATGSFRRLDASGSRPAYFAAAAFAETRTEEHIRRFHPLVVDRTAWNKVFRRSFWDEHGFRFAEGVTYEDQYATLPAYFLARSVEVLSSPVYYWRIRGDGDRSITQGREEPSAVRDRLTAIRWTSRWLAERGFHDDKLWYDASVFAQDLVYVPDVLAEATDDDRSDLVPLVDGFLADADAQVHDGLPAVDRLAWHLVRAHDWDRLREVRRFKAEACDRSRPVRRLRHWYLDAPGRGDRDLPRELFRLDDEIEAVSRVAGLSVDGGRLRVDGAACLSRLGAGSRRDQKLQLHAVDDDGQVVPFDVRPVARPDLDAVNPPVAADTGWAGYVATLDLDGLGAAAIEPGDWRVVVEVQGRGVRRTTEQHVAARLCPLRGAVSALGDGRQLRAEVAGDRLLLHVEPGQAVLTAASLEADATLVLEGSIPSTTSGGATSGWLRLSGAVDKGARWPVDVAGSGPHRTFTARLPLSELRSDLDLPTAPQTLRRQALEQWDLTLRIGKTSSRLVLAPELTGRAWTAGDRSWLLGTNRPGVAVLVERVPRPVFDTVAIEPDGATVLGAQCADAWPAGALLLDDGTGRTLPLELDRGDRIVRVPPPTADGGAAAWDVVVRLAGSDGRTVPCALAEPALADLPLARTTDRGLVVVGVRGRDGPVVYR
jgi:CDP-glycerol glycerophosphotransferase